MDMCRVFLAHVSSPVLGSYLKNEPTSSGGGKTTVRLTQLLRGFVKAGKKDGWNETSKKSDRLSVC